MANLQANQAAGRGERRSRTRAGTGTSPLPIYLAYFNGRDDANNAGGLHGHATGRTARSSAGWRARTRARQSAASDLDGNAGAPRQRARRGPAGEPLRAQPGRRATVGVYHQRRVQRATTRCRSKLRRRLSRGFQINGSYQYALEERLGVPRPALRPRQQLRPPTSGTRSRCSGTGRVPVGRGRRFGTDMNPWLDARRRRLGVQRRRPHPGARRSTSATCAWSA